MIFSPTSVVLLVFLALLAIVFLLLLITRSAAAKSVARSQEERITWLEQELEAKQNETGKIQAEKDDLLQQLATEKSENKHLKELQEKAGRELEKRQKQLETEFTVLVQKILDERTDRLAKMEKEKLESILSPFRQNLKDFQDRIETTHKDETEKLTRLDQELKRLMDLNRQLDEDARGLTKALKGDNKAQGNWGEWQLEKILEKSGLEKNVHFKTQATFSDEGKKKQPDFVIHLPDGKHLVIDAKVSLKAYEQFFSCEDESERNSFLIQHVQSVKSHIKSLGEKDYQSLTELKSPDYILMFVPIEPAFSAAFRYDDSLYQLALDNNIVIVTTSTLLATMRTVSFIWTQENQRRNVLEIARQGGLMYDRLAGLLAELQKMGGQLQSAQNSYDKVMKKVSDGKGNLLDRAEKMKKLGAQTSRTLPENLPS